MTGATGNYYCGLHEFEDMAFVANLLRPNDHFVDIGANVGSYTILASGESGANTIAVEPLPNTFSRLRRNVRQNDLDDLVTLCNLGIGDEVTQLQFTTSLDTVNHVVTKVDQNVEVSTVDVVPLDSLLKDVEPLCIKIDVEGFEQKVIDGAPNSLQSIDLRAVLLELNGSGGRYGFSDDDIHQKMTDYGFEPHTYDPLNRKLQSLTGHHTEGNTLYIRDMPFVQERLESAPAINLPWRTI